MSSSNPAFGDLRLPSRFWAKCCFEGPTGCWTWTAGKTDAGYGQFRIGRRMLGAHRVTYQTLVGEIPAGLQLDHLCRTRCCVNPIHLEPVTSRENTLRGTGLAAQRAKRTQCPRGHGYTPENTGVSRGKRYCKACHATWRSRVRAVVDL